MRGPGRRKKSKSSFSPAHLCLLSVRTESKAPGRVRRLQGSERYHWVAGGLYNLRPIQNIGSAQNGALRRVDVVIDPYGALRIVALRDGSMCDA